MATLLLMSVLWLIASPAYAHDGPHNIDCGGPEIIIEGGQPPAFTLPAQSDETLEVDPQAVLTIRGIAMPADASLHWGVQGLGTELAGKDLQFTSGVTTINVADFSTHARGIFEIEGTLFSGPIELCTIPFKLNISGFGGTTALVATGVSVVAAAGALASAPLASTARTAQLTDNSQDAWPGPGGCSASEHQGGNPSSIFSTLVGAVTGLGLAVLMQQAGINPLTLASAVWGLALGGGVSFGVGYSLGVVKTLLKPPVED